MTHSLFIIFLVIIFNVLMSWFGCYSAAGFWAYAKVIGGNDEAIAWCMACLSTIGFSSAVGTAIGYAFYASGHLAPGIADMAYHLWFFAMITPAIAFAVAVACSLFSHRRDDITYNASIEVYQNIATLHAEYGAIQGIGEALSDVGSSFSGGSSDSKDDPIAALIFLIVLLVCSIAIGTIITAILIRLYAGRRPIPDRPDIPRSGIAA